MHRVESVISATDVLDAFVSLDEPRDLLERFIARRLAEAGVWSSARASDGVNAYRVVERGRSHLRVCGTIWHIGQTLHAFWLDVQREPCAPAHARWTLYFDIDMASAIARSVREAIEVMQHPGEVRWLVTREGADQSETQGA